MIMDGRDIKSDLLALQKLYGLLKNEGDGNANPALNMLDDHARLILKHLLDSATQSALKVYSEILAGQVGVLRTPGASHLQQTDNTIEEQSSRIQMTREVDQSYRMGSDKERKVDGLDFKLWNDQRLIRQRSRVDSIEKSTPSADARAEFRKKRCRVCQRSTVKQMVTNDDIAKYSDIYKRVEADSISKEASEAIEQLESCISDLKIGSDHVHLIREFSCQHENMDSNDVAYQFTSQSDQSPLNQPSHQIFGVSTEVRNQPSAKVQPTKSMFCQSNGHFPMSGGTYEMRESNDEPKMPPIHGQKMKTTRDQIESGNWRTHNDYWPNVRNVGVAADHGASPWPSTFSPVPKMESPLLIPSVLKNERNRYGVFQPSKLAKTIGNPNYSEKLQYIDSSHNIASKWGSRVERRPPNTTAMLQECPHQSDRHHKNGIATSRNWMTASRMSLNKQNSEDTSSSLYLSNTKSQQASSYGSVGEDYSFSDQTGSHYNTSSTSSDSGSSPQSHGTMRDYDSCTSKSEDDSYSSTSSDGTTPEVTSSSSGKSEGYSSYNQPTNHHAGSTYSYSSMKSTSRKKVPGGISKSASGINHKKPSSTWKRLKDRLAIISHHHHHHHHHHHDSQDDHRQGSHWKKINVGTLFKKHEGKTIRSKQGDEAYGEMAVEKMRKSLMHDKHQKGHFHGLVEAFLSHIWHSKKSKLAKGTSGKLATNLRGQKKTLKKSQWWKVLQHQRRRKFPKKATVKLVLGRKKKPFKGTPKLK